MARTSQRDRVQRIASSGASRSRYSCRDRQFGAIQSVAPTFGVELTPINLRDPGEIERAISAFARSSNGGFFVTAGGLISYGTDVYDLYRRAAGYIDRVLKGEKPSDLPVQAPIKFETVVNIKTAKALGITMPVSLLTRTNDLIE